MKKNKLHLSKYLLRQKIIQETRNYFIKRGFVEVETPILKPHLIPESYIEVFETFLLNRNRKKMLMYLSPSPESSLKKLLANGIGDCFEITKAFRNMETASHTHNPEFTLIEWYRIDATYSDIMKDCEDWLKYLTLKVKKSKKIVYQGKKIDLSSPWERLTVSAAFKKYADLSIENHLSLDKLAPVASKRGYNIRNSDTWEQIYHQIYLNEIEPHLGTRGEPTIIYDYPRSQAALARLKPSDTRFAERFEFYIAGLELGDCYTELTDSIEQRRRFKEEIRLRRKSGKINIKPDNDFLKTLEDGLPSCAGIAVGLDRLAMLFTDSKSIDEVLYFPINNWIK